jgi:pyruvate dehydrogenase E2 component (dihydrolipoamide acetyltransferase)
LLVPVLRDVGRKNMAQLAAEVDAVAKRCREGNIAPADLEGGSFTVTNLGAIGGSYFTPIVNYPEVAILGLGRASRQAVPNARDELEIRTILPLSLSYDHRLIDGAEAARFARWVAEAIEEPFLLALEGAS